MSASRFALLLITLISAASMGEEVEIDLLKSAWRLIPQQKEPPDAAIIRKCSNHLDCKHRIWAAYILRDSLIPDRNGLLEKLQKDTDPIVRRVASESLLGEKFTEPAIAKRFDYVHVLETESTVKNTFEKMRKADPKEQYALTQSLIKIGRPSIWALQPYLDDKDEAMRLTAQFGLQEVNFRSEAIEPDWAVDIRKKLNKKVSFNFIDKPILDAIDDIAKLVNLAIDVDNKLKGKLREVRTTLRVEEMEAALALKWVTRLANLDMELSDGRVEMFEFPPIACGTQIALVDVRDLESAGLKHWTEDEELHWVKANAVYFRCDHGFIAFSTPLGMSAVRAVAQIEKYLNTLRTSKGLPDYRYFDKHERK